MAEVITLQGVSEDIVRKLDANGVVGVDPGTLLELIPALIQLFASCKREIPKNPKPDPTPAEQKAYELHYTATEGYDEEQADYERALLHRTATRCKRERKRDGEKISRSEAVNMARVLLDEARLKDIASLAIIIEQSA